uniref:Ig-like domain-containing protein n=1 Tax=Sparus aurata TaxID=8175 RepID=A0A671TNB0_SPAAU
STGSVILESPAVPVKDGDAVTLRCRNKETSTNLKADFYKHGHLIRSSSTGKLTIHSVSKSDEGFYKCRISGAGESPERWLALIYPMLILKKTFYIYNDSSISNRHNLLNCSDASVILESPVLPVVERDAVTLSCRKKKTSSNLTADFYKDGLLIRSSSTGEMTIHRVSKSDEGLYKCRISGAGESPESWLAVRVSSLYSLTTIHTRIYLALATNMTASWGATSRPNDFETQSSQVSLTTLQGHSHTEFKSLRLRST